MTALRIQRALTLPMGLKVPLVLERAKMAILTIGSDDPGTGCHRTAAEDSSLPSSRDSKTLLPGHTANGRSNSTCNVGDGQGWLRLFMLISELNGNTVLDEVVQAEATAHALL